MKKKIVSIIIYSTLALLISVLMIAGSVIFLKTLPSKTAQIEIDQYRLCKDEHGNDIIIIKYLLINNRKSQTQLFYEGDFYVYQNGVSLSEYEGELPHEYDYDPGDQYKYVKGGVEFYGEIAYLLDDPCSDVEVEVNDYGFFEKTKEKTFKLQ